MKLSLLAAVLATAIAATAVAEPIHPAVAGDLVAADGRKLTKFDDSTLAPVQYYAFYYSAAWCGPCRTFTPSLVKWYNEHKKANPHFELIFVSSDNSAKEMAGYMAGDQMPWPALSYAKTRSNKTVRQYAGSGIPCLVLVDAQGKVLSDSYDGEKYLGPNKVLQDIEKTLAANPPSVTAGAPATPPARPTGSGSGSFDDFFKKQPATQ